MSIIMTRHQLLQDGDVFEQDGEVFETRLVIANSPIKEKRHKPRNSGCRNRELPPELRESEEAKAVWAASLAASDKARRQETHGWTIIWTPRPHGKAGDFYAYPPEHKQPHRRQLRSYSAVIDWLLIRHDTSSTGGAAWQPPERTQLIEVLCSAGELGDDDDEILEAVGADTDEARAAALSRKYIQSRG